MTSGVCGWPFDFCEPASAASLVGALHDILTLFKKHKINMTKIESRPTKKKAWQYIFFVDFLGHAGEKNIRTLLKSLQDNCPFMKVLGSYPKAEKPE